MHSRPGPKRTFAVLLALALALTGIVGTTSATFAAGKGKKADYETFVVTHIDALANCVGLDDPRACVQSVGGTEIYGFGFAIAAFLKFKAHRDNPGLDVDALQSCLTEGTSADGCLDEQGARIGGSSMPGLAAGILAHFVLRDACTAGDVDCSETPETWPSAWDWAYE